MPAATAAMTQMNVRVNAEHKRSAEAVLKLADCSLTELVRMVIEKVSHGSKDLEEVQLILQNAAASVPSSETDEVLLEGWTLVDNFCKEQGIGLVGDWVDGRTCDQIYDEAMMAHYEEKGLLQ